MGTPAARLEVVSGTAAGMSILVADELVIGRHSDGAGRLADDEEISRTHARIVLDPGSVCSIEDLGSTNGTFVNGLQISTPRTLSEGDTVEMGATTLVVRDLPAQPQASDRTPLGQPTVTPVPTASTPPSDSSLTPSSPQATMPPVPAAPASAAAEEPESKGLASLSLRLEVDFESREALIHLDDAGEPVRLAVEDGAWRYSPRENE